jgi:hypothetical protein
VSLSISDFGTIAQLILAVQPDVDARELDRQLRKIARDQEAKSKRDPIKLTAEVEPKRGGRGGVGGGPGRSTGGAALLGGGLLGTTVGSFSTRTLAQGQGLSTGQTLKGGLGLTAMRLGGGFAAGGAAIFGLGAATKEYLDIVGNGIMAISGVEEQVAASEQVYGNAAKKIQDYAKTTAEAYGLTETNAVSMANGLGIWGDAMGFSKDRTADFSIEMMDIAADLAAFNDVSMDQAQAAIMSGFAGQSRPLRGLKIDVTESEKVRALEKRGIEAAKGSLTKQQKALGTYYSIIDQIGPMKGQAEREKEQTATQMRRVEAMAEQLWVDFGRGIKEGFGGEFNNLFEGIIQQFAKFGPMIERIGELVGETLLPVMEKVDGVIERLAPKFESFAEVLVPIMSNLADVFLDAIEVFGPAIMELIQGFMVLVDQIVKSPLVAWMGRLIAIGLQLAGVMLNFIAVLWTAFSALFEDPRLKASIDELLDSLSELATTLSETLIELMPFITPAIRSLANSISWLAPMVQGIANFFTGLAESINDNVIPTLERLPANLETVKKMLWNFINALFWIPKALSLVFLGAVMLINKGIQGIGNSIETQINRVIDMINGLFIQFNNLSGAAAKLLGFDEGIQIDLMKKVDIDWMSDEINELQGNIDFIKGWTIGDSLLDNGSGLMDTVFDQMRKNDERKDFWDDIMGQVGGLKKDPDGKGDDLLNLEENPTGGMGSGSGGGGRGGGDVYINVLVEANAIADSTTIRKAVNQALKEGAVDLRRLQGAAA